MAEPINSRSSVTGISPEAQGRADGENPSQADRSVEGREPSRAAIVEALFREHNQRLVRFLAARLSSDAEAKEVAQEAYVRLLQLEQPDAGGFMRALLYKTAINIATDRIRRRKLDRESLSTDPLDFGIDRCSPEQHVSSREEVEIVSQCLNELSPRCRQAILLRRLQGLSTAQIAATLNVSTRMIRLYITEASLLIRDRLDSTHARHHTTGMNKEVQND